MSNGLTQAEIDALLSGMDKPNNSGNSTANAADSADPGQASGNFPEASDEEKNKNGYEGVLTSMEVDTIGEIGNISMGTSATTLNTLLNKRVSITTPKVAVYMMEDLIREHQSDVMVEVAYTNGLEGKNIMFVQEKDVKIITDLLMGGDGTNIDVELNEMHLSAISEVMNQMVGSSSTSLAMLMDKQIDIAPPKAYSVDYEMASQIIEDPIVAVSFKMEIEGLVNSEIIQAMPAKFGKELVKNMMNAQGNPLLNSLTTRTSNTPQTNPVSAAAQPAAAPRQNVSDAGATPASKSAPQFAGESTQPPAQSHGVVDVRPVQYASFDEQTPAEAESTGNLDLLMDVPLQISVELGKSKKYLREILDFNLGTIIVLDKMAGELVDIVVNGKLIARGEVVVIDDNYGARITDIVSPAKRFSGN